MFAINNNEQAIIPMIKIITLKFLTCIKFKEYKRISTALAQNVRKASNARNPYAEKLPAMVIRHPIADERETPANATDAKIFSAFNISLSLLLGLSPIKQIKARRAKHKSIVEKVKNVQMSKNNTITAKDNESV